MSREGLLKYKQRRGNTVTMYYWGDKNEKSGLLGIVIQFLTRGAGGRNYVDPSAYCNY